MLCMSANVALSQISVIYTLLNEYYLQSELHVPSKSFFGPEIFK